MLIILFELKKLRAIWKFLSLKLMTESGLPGIKIFFSKDCTKNWAWEIFIIDSVLKTSPWTYNIKDLNEKIMISFYGKKIVVK